MKKFIALFLFVSIGVGLMGCAGKVIAPHIYSPEETLSGGIGPSLIPKGSTGEIAYCDSGMAFQVKSRREQAYAAIASACKGEDKYTIVGDLLSGGQARTVVLGGIETSCPGLSGRKIIFKCTGAIPRPSGLRSHQ
jgi:hypothetical protein